jgi:hypothetical protein
VPIDPGDDEEARKKAVAGCPYNVIFLPAHWAGVHHALFTENNNE